MSEETKLFVKGSAALLLKREKCLAVSDLHIGMEFQLREEGLHFSDASRKMARRISELYKDSGAKRLVIIGDVKQSISYPEREERDAIRGFFTSLECDEVTILRGNHDARIGEILKSMGFDYAVDTELKVGGATFLHGNGWPSEGAFESSYIVEGHSHFAARIGEVNEKVWLVADVGKRIGAEYKAYKRGIKLVVMPAFNDLIIGKAISGASASRHPLFKNRIFDFGSSRIYGLSGEFLGSANEVQVTQG